MDKIKEAASLLGRIGRKKNTAAQAEASRRNGKLGGAPKKKTEDKPCNNPSG